MMFNCPFPFYWMCHILVALLIALFLWPVVGFLWVYCHPFGGLLAGLITGATFYISREVRDREKLGYWDWPGLLCPVGVCLLVGLGCFFLSH